MINTMHWRRNMPNGTCGVISFGLKGGRQAAGEFMDKLKLAAIVTHVADARTCVLHPASHTHRQLSDEQLREAGVDPADPLRVSGIENVDDIIEISVRRWRIKMPRMAI